MFQVLMTITVFSKQRGLSELGQSPASLRWEDTVAPSWVYPKHF